MKRRHLGWLTAGFALLASACADDLLPAGTNASDETGDEVTVTFTVSPEGQTHLTRADVGSDYVHYPEAGEFAQISDGSKATQLHYAVYNDKYQLLEQYGDDDHQDPEKPHYGQTIVNLEKFPYTIELRLIRNQTYHIAFWAQAPNCKAYDTNELTQVHVLYTKKTTNAEGEEVEEPFKNNDELRDAFCKVETFSVDATAPSRSVVLTRPLAQINVGTAGYNYEYTMPEASDSKPEATADDSEEEDSKSAGDGSTVEASLAYLYSTITLEGVASYFDVVRNKVLTKDDLATGNYPELKEDDVELQTVEYSYARIPAYVNYGKYNEETGEFVEDDLPKCYPKADLPTEEKKDNESYTDYYRRFKEQFLRVKFCSEAGSEVPYLPYVGLDDPTAKDNPDTETFKYLSMCYVLVPDYVKADGSDAYSTTLSHVTVLIATQEGYEFQIGPEGDIEYSVENVPVQRNYRTNIFGKHLIGYDYQPIIDLSPIYNGEYNKDGDSNWTQNPEPGDEASNGDDDTTQAED